MSPSGGPTTSGKLISWKNQVCDHVGRLEISRDKCRLSDLNGASNFLHGAKFSADVASRSAGTQRLEVMTASVLLIRPADTPVY